MITMDTNIPSKQIRIRTAIALPVIENRLHKKKTVWGSATMQFVKLRPNLQADIDRYSNDIATANLLLGLSDESLQANKNYAIDLLNYLERRAKSITTVEKF